MCFVGTMSSYSYSRDETISNDRPLDDIEGPEINEVCRSFTYWLSQNNSLLLTGYHKLLVVLQTNYQNNNRFVIVTTPKFR